MSTQTQRILLIHANSAIKDMLLVCLETISSWEIITAASGVEGIEKALEADAVLLDIDEIMPDLCWREIVQSLQQNPSTNSVPLILLTATPQSQEILEFQQTQTIESEIQAIAKSFNLFNLASQILRLLDRS